MVSSHFKIIILLLITVFCQSSNSGIQDTIIEKKLALSMRMIGHQVLLQSGDSTSVVLPIKKEGDRYRIQFESIFQFMPDDLVPLIDSVMTSTGIVESYLVEVEECDSKEIIYGYSIGDTAHSSMIPCRRRVQPEDCYSILITILDNIENTASIDEEIAIDEGLTDLEKSGLIGIIILIIVALVFTLIKRKNSKLNSNVISIGNYKFDKRNMKLIYDDINVELTSKEADLLYLLHSSANDTLERDVILKLVWGDEGDYVGRTLDVFISKLRKKLENDPNVKIANIRGIGYKLVLND